MKKRYRNGFMLAEVVIVSVVVLGTLVGLYSIFTKMYVVYNERSYYENVDSIYALRNIYKNLIDNKQMVNIINDGLKEKEPDKLNYIDLINSSTCGNGYIEEEFCNKLKETYGITKVLFVRYNETSINDLISSTSNSSINDYINYLQSSMDFTEDFSYMFLIELKDNEYLYYGNYRIR